MENFLTFFFRKFVNVENILALIIDTRWAIVKYHVQLPKVSFRKEYHLKYAPNLQNSMFLFVRWTFANCQVYPIKNYSIIMYFNREKPQFTMKVFEYLTIMKHRNNEWPKTENEHLE